MSISPRSSSRCLGAPASLIPTPSGGYGSAATLAGLDQLAGLHAERKRDFVDARRVDAATALGLRDGVLRNARLRGQLLDGEHVLPTQLFQLNHVYFHAP